jgi:hypothetical protein
MAKYPANNPPYPSNASGPPRHGCGTICGDFKVRWHTGLVKRLSLTIIMPLNPEIRRFGRRITIK